MSRIAAGIHSWIHTITIVAAAMLATMVTILFLIRSTSIVVVLSHGAWRDNPYELVSVFTLLAPILATIVIGGAMLGGFHR